LIKAKTPPTSGLVKPIVKCLLLGAIALSFVLAGLWRVSADKDFSPGRISVVTLLLSIALFLAFDLRAKFPLGGWLGVALLISFHQLATVHAEPFPHAFIYLGGPVFRIDHLLHLLAGVLVGWLSWYLVLALRPEVSRGAVVTVVMLMLVTFGFLKEGSDVLTLRGVGKDLDSFDTVWDSTGNVIGAGLALSWLMKKRAKSEPSDPYAPP
jgi:hypothetical protein